MKSLIDTYKNDRESVYHTWFLHSTERLKAFRTIRKGMKVFLKKVRRLFLKSAKNLQTFVVYFLFRRYIT